MALKDRVLQFFLERPGESLNAKQIYSSSDLKNDYQVNQIYAAMQELAKEEKLQQQSTSKFTLNVINRTFEGVVEGLRDKDYEIWVNDLAERVMVPIHPDYLLMIGDKILVKIVEQKLKYSIGEFVELLEGEKREFVGRIYKDGKRLFFSPDDRKIDWEYEITGKVPMSENGKKAVAKLFANEYGLPALEITEILGEIGNHEAEMHAIIYEFGLKTGFSEEAIAEAEKLSEIISPEEVQKRRDFRGTWTITIDPEDAKDFDDALSLTILENGNYEVGVHIADVSHFVKPKSALDKDAQEKATSVYLVDRTIPMLPEKISNFLCSLRPNEDKYAFSAVFEMNLKGNIVKEWFGKTIIRSVKRFTYEEAQEILETKTGEHAENLEILNQLAYSLRNKRVKNGSINFETEEIRFRLDENFKPVKVIPKIRKDVHKLIEDFMLLTNQQVAKFISKKKKIPMVYRVHDRPSDEKLKDLKNFVETLGFQLNIENDKSFRKSLNAITAKIEGTPQMEIIANIAIRSMAKAVYQTENIGHYALAFQYYSHFTSPIRRYPDLLAHRILMQALEKPSDILYSEEQLAKLCKHSSMMEKKASDAERASVKFKLVEFMGDFVWETFTGTISGLTSWGFYVQISEYRAEGLVSIKSLGDDTYTFDEKKFMIYGKKHKKTFLFGDVVNVRVIKTDLINRTIDLELLSTEKYGTYSPANKGSTSRSNNRFRKSLKKKR